jgi:uncharacterized protein with NAD-binding domain and iron-sulfur cluster
MKVTIIGGGVAGLQTAIALKELGVTPIIIEKENHLGGKLCGWHKLFPTMTPRSAYTWTHAGHGSNGLTIGSMKYGIYFATIFTTVDRYG